MVRKYAGFGPRTVSRVVAAAQQMRTALEGKTGVRIDPDTRPAEHAALLIALRRYEVACPLVPPKGPGLAPLAARIGGLLESAGRAASRTRMFFTWSGRTRRESRDALAGLAATLRSPEAVEARDRHAVSASAVEEAVSRLAARIRIRGNAGRTGCRCGCFMAVRGASLVGTSPAVFWRLYISSSEGGPWLARA